MKYSIPLALFAAVRTFTDGVNAEFTVIHRSLICSHFVICSPFASSERTRRSSGWPPIDRWWLLLAFIGRSHLRDHLNACSIDDLNSCCWLLGAMSFTSSAKNKWLQVSSFSRSFINIRNRRGPSTEPWGKPLFTTPTPGRWPPKFSPKVLFFRNSSTHQVFLRWILIATIFLTSSWWHTESKQHTLWFWIAWCFWIKWYPNGEHTHPKAA